MEILLVAVSLVAFIASVMLTRSIAQKNGLLDTKFADWDKRHWWAAVSIVSSLGVLIVSLFLKLG